MNAPVTISSRDFMAGDGWREYGAHVGASRKYVPDAPPADAQRLADVVRARGPIAARDAMRLAGLPASSVHNLLVTVTMWFPIYEEDTVPGGTVVLGWNHGIPSRFLPAECGTI